MIGTPYTLHLGDCRAVLATLPDSSVDSIVTDPPYHLTTGKKGGSGQASVNLSSPHGRARIGTGFMGMAWDGGDVAMRAETWAELMRVLKPGGHLLAFSGSRTYHRMACAIEDGGFEIRDQIMWLYGSGFPKSMNLDGAWEGWGTALKPAHEPICVARKPFKGTCTANVLEHGTGALNIDACRVPSSTPVQSSAGKGAPFGAGAYPLGEGRMYQDAGRWPANVIHDGSPEVLEAFPSAPGQIARSSSSSSRKAKNVYGAMARGSGGMDPRDDLDKSAARFFYCAKASRADRNGGLPDPGAQFKKGTTLRAVEVAAAAGELSGNTHPTVKPTDLMAYLCRLVTPPGGVVLDPFMGSGSTGKAAMREGFRFIGIDMTPEYVEIARARITASWRAAEAVRKVCEPSLQIDLFEVVT
jgi:site-specific DNA-methyltransferase (adenine-specific)